MGGNHKEAAGGMVHAIVQDKTGGPEVLRWEEVTVPAPGAGEVLLSQTAVGVNFLDVYHRSGRYPVSHFPLTIGAEAVGVVEAVGEGVTGFAPGDRAGYAARAPGAYAEARVVPAAWLVAVPDDIGDGDAAALMLKGFTAEYLLHRIHAVRPGETVLVHAAAGAMGQLLCRWAKALGAVVLGTVSTEEKARAARGAGCDHAILYRSEDFAARARELTGGRGCDVVYDAVGKDTFAKSLEALAVLGHLVSYGQASGPVPPLEIARLAADSLTLSRPNLFHYSADRGRLEEMASRVFGAARAGAVQPGVNQRFALRDAAHAHRALEARETIAATVLIP